MADSSFYGGRPGFSFIIVANYASVNEMIENFQQGPSYEAVHFDEHVLINTENKNDPDNGKIYRRGYDYTNDIGGAIYVGTIVGPAGPAPMLEFTTIAEVKAIQETEGYDYRYSEGSYAPTENLIAGKDDIGNYNDEIQWACCCVRDENGEDSTAYIGFIIPYLVADFEADSVSPYYNRSNSTNDFINENLTERVDDQSHPFYEKWHFNIPKGIKGDSLNNFRVIIADNAIQEYEGQADDIENGREILVYDYYNYDNNETGDPVSLYLGDYNMIDNVTFDNEGTIVISYSHDDDVTYSKLLKWIDSVTLSTNGKFVVTYNQTDSDGNAVIYETQLSWVSNIALSEDGIITITYCNGNMTSLPEKIKWINSVTLGADGKFVVTYNQTDENGNAITYETQLSWVSDINLSEDGTITITYCNGNIMALSEKLKWITSISIQDDGTFVVTYNDDTTTELTKIIKCISSVIIETADVSGEEGTGDQKIHIIYNTGEEEIIGEPLNYIMETALETDTYHLLVRYSDPVKRQIIVDNGENFEYNGINDWYDLGSIKDYSGILVGLNISGEEGSNVSYIVNLLNSMYPNGLQGDLQGKVITIGGDLDNKYFYAYDYAKNSWFYLGNFNVDLSSLMMIASENDFDLSSKQNALNVGGFWFVLEDD